MEKDLIEQLISLKNKKFKELKKYEELLLECKKSIDEINAQICFINGHTFSDWRQLQNLGLDKNCYYERRCEVCGKIERSYDVSKSNEYTLKMQSTK